MTNTVNERDYTKGGIFEPRTPRTPTNARGRRTTDPDTTMYYISMWICSPGDTLEQDKWIHCVELEQFESDVSTGRISRHYFLDERDAWIFRSHYMGSDKVHMVTDGEMSVKGNRVVHEYAIQEVYFEGRTLWDGYTLEEITNITAKS